MNIDDNFDDWSSVVDSASLEDDSGFQDGHTNDFETVSSYNLEDFKSVKELDDNYEIIDCRLDLPQNDKTISVFKYSGYQIDDSNNFHHFALEIMDVYPMLQYAWQQIREHAVFVEDRRWLAQEMNFFYRCVNQFNNIISAFTGVRYSKKKESLINKCNEMLDLITKSTVTAKRILNETGPLPIKRYDELAMSDYWLKCASMIVVAILDDHRPLNKTQLELAEFWNVMDNIEDSAVYCSKIDRNVKLGFNGKHKH